MQDFFSKKNYLGIALGIAVLGVGFFLLGLGPADNKIALNVAPFVLIIAYAIILPLSILMGQDKDGKK
jgi:hypothetical protein